MISRSFCLQLSLCSFCFLVSPVYATTSTISVGYAQSHLAWHGHAVQNSPQGINIKYRYNINEELGLIGSFTYTNKSKRDYLINGKTKLGSGYADYASWTAGPAYRINDFISAYGLIGISHFRTGEKVEGGVDKERRNSFVYGGGLQFDATKDISLDVSYEKAKAIKLNGNTWILGLGYKF